MLEFFLFLGLLIPQLLIFETGPAQFNFKVGSGSLQTPAAAFQDLLPQIFDQILQDIVVLDKVGYLLLEVVDFLSMLILCFLSVILFLLISTVLLLSYLKLLNPEFKFEVVLDEAVTLFSEGL